MFELGYTPEMFELVKSDAFNYQGVGCPHLHAKIKPDEAVLDVGSGLGIDSTIAALQTRNKVVGLDFSQKQVQHAQMRANARGLENLSFVHADMERMPLPEN